MRHWLVLAHRFVGLAMAGFLVFAGITGALLAWYHELDAAINPALFHAAPSSLDVAPLDALALRERVLQQYPDAWSNRVPLDYEPGHATVFYLAGAIDPATGQRHVLPNDEIFVDPYSGSILGERKWGDPGQGWSNIMPFVFRLHYSLALEEAGRLALGVIALLWTLDCFVGAWLTFPARRSTKGGKTAKSWSSRWKAAWKLRWRSGATKLNFDLHRAGGLWLWAALFVFAWSGVAFNLAEVYHPVMRVMFENQPKNAPPAATAAAVVSAETWRAGLAAGRAHMRELAVRERFDILQEQDIYYFPATGHFRYQVRSSRDANERYGSTGVTYEADTGRLVNTYLPTGQAAGDTITSWLLALHAAARWGTPFQAVVCVLGLAIAALSITGAVIWWQKRRAAHMAAVFRLRQSRG